GVERPTAMLLLAPRHVQEVHMSKTTTKRLASHGLLDEAEPGEEPKRLGKEKEKESVATSSRDYGAPSSNTRDQGFRQSSPVRAQRSRRIRAAASRGKGTRTRTRTQSARSAPRRTRRTARPSPPWTRARSSRCRWCSRRKARARTACCRASSGAGRQCPGQAAPRRLKYISRHG
ncbi:hypothetical protein B0H13DRAFT_2116458, partial [Mycena leptocephala]